MNRNLKLIGRAMPEPEHAPVIKPRRLPKFISLAPFIAERLVYRSDRSMPWIMLYTSMLDDDRFNSLDDASQAHVIKLMLLVARTGTNRFTTNQVELARKINAKGVIQIELILKSKCFIAAKRIRSNISLTPQTDRQTEIEKKTTDKTAAAASSASSSSNFSYSQWLRYAHAHPSIRDAERFARVRSSTADAVAIAEMNDWIAATKPPRPAKKDCAKCGGSGFEQMDHNSVRRCECKHD